jgi:cobyrinic acid a,c-diamide synthase
MNIPRIIIAGTHSGCGKTTIADGIMASLMARHLKVQPFKVGPDFIDPSHHTRICGRFSRNLDPFMMHDQGCVDTFLRSSEGADIAVIEGVMGLFDGVDGSDISSTAHVARILNAPIILIVDAKGMSRSVHALIKGYREYDPTITISGIIFNQIGSKHHRQMIESSLQVPEFGWIPRKKDLAIKSRHLGLHMAHETELTLDLGSFIEEHCNISKILDVARQAPPLDKKPQKIIKQDSKTRIGIAWDKAFCFYYQDNLDTLRSAGAELVFFSPLSDKKLPDLNGVYIGGGYPELYLKELETSKFLTDFTKSVNNGMPVYAECGGLLYLTEGITTDRFYKLCGILPATTEMSDRVQALGYVSGESMEGSSVLPSGLSIRGHEFHYSKLIPDSDARYTFRLSRGKVIVIQSCG